jgi:hypothetical protein
MNSSWSVRQVVNRIVELGLVDAQAPARELDSGELHKTLDYFGRPDHPVGLHRPRTRTGPQNLGGDRKSGRVRAAAIEGLRRTYWRERANIATLGNRAYADPDPQVRTAALEALVDNWPDEPGVQELTKALAETEPDHTCRATAQQLLTD